MRVLVAAFAFNEIKYIADWVRYYSGQGCELLVVDNYSTDGTYEWCGKHGVHTGRVDTNDAFNLLILQRSLTDHIHKLKPDWVVYSGIDLYQIFPGGIRDVISKAEAGGHNIIEVDHFEAFNTGEEVKVPLTMNHFYTRQHGRLRMIAKPTDGFKLIADNIIVTNPSVYHSDGVLINYGMCKPREEREVTFARRKRAWELGMHKGWGIHYVPAKKTDWVWEKKTLWDIRKNQRVYELIKQTWNE